MKTLLLTLIYLILGLGSCKAQYQYPPTKTIDVVETHWGTKINDPYRWIEDIKNPEVVNWFSPFTP